MTRVQDSSNTQAENRGKYLRCLRAALVATGLALMGGTCLAAGEAGDDAIAPDAWENLAQIASTGASDSALAGSRGMGSVANSPDALAVIMWDEKNTCCVKPGVAPAPGPEGNMNSVSFRVVIQR